MSTPIADYGFISNLHTAALVSRRGSIDWFCPPRFDAPACFTALLGDKDHGYWSIEPVGHYETRRLYHQDTLILETRYSSQSGELAVMDFMPIGSTCLVVRQIRGIRGQLPLRMICMPRFGYGRDKAVISRDSGYRFSHEQGSLVLHSDLLDECRVDAANAGIEVEFSVNYDEQHYFILHYCDATEGDKQLTVELTRWHNETFEWWRQWLNQCNYEGPYKAQVKRSLSVIKALIHEPSGGVVAAPTTSLPEYLGGSANWDYRYCWLRDASLALDVLMGCNYGTEAMRWYDWLLKAAGRHHDMLRPLYTLDATIIGEEVTLDWLPGYAGSRPVRAGNAAGHQYQMDLRGELVEVLHVGRKTGLEFTGGIWELQKTILKRLAIHWKQPDAGFWEFRGELTHLTASKVMAWVAYDRSIRDAEDYKLPCEELDSWYELRDAIRDDVLEKGVDPQLQRFVDRYGSKGLDASLLLIPLVGFLPATDPRVVNTIAAIEEDLCHHGLVYRFKTDDDSWYNKEGAFLLCSFWLVDNYWMAGRQAEAKQLFERLLSLANDLGLYAEEYDPQRGIFLGNFPQALTHLGLVNSARLLTGQEVFRHGYTNQNPGNHNAGPDS